MIRNCMEMLTGLCVRPSASLQCRGPPGWNSDHHAGRVYRIQLGRDQPVWPDDQRCAHIATLILLVFYLTLDVVFSIAFLAYAIPVAWLATNIGTAPACDIGHDRGNRVSLAATPRSLSATPLRSQCPSYSNIRCRPTWLRLFSRSWRSSASSGSATSLFKQVQIRVEELRQQQTA